MEDKVKNEGRAERLEKLLLHFNLTARKLAEIVGLNENTLYKISAGLNEMSDKTAAKICYQLKLKKGVAVSRQWLLTGEGDMIEPGSPIMDVAAEDEAAYGKPDWKNKYFALLEKYTELLESRMV